MESNNQNNNQNETEQLGVRDANALPLLRKRSSLKQRSSIKDGGVRFSNVNRKITWTEDINKDENKSEKSYSDSKTRFSSAVIRF